MAMSQLEDIQLASERVGLEVTREVGARVRRNLERDCADRKKKTSTELNGVPELSDAVQSQGKVPGEKKAVGIQGRSGVQEGGEVWSPGVMATGKCRLLCSGLKVDRDEELEGMNVESH